jgi:colanic acid biosynthesis glycosyl transferase WcaI
VRGRPHLLVLNEYYWPGREATAHLLTELCEGLARELEVTVVTGLPRTPNVRPGSVVRNGVRIVRVPSTAFDRRRLVFRALNYGTYLALSLIEGMRVRRPDAVLAMTDPPVVGVIAVAVGRRRRVPVITVCQDVFPEIAVALHRLDNAAIVGVLEWLTRLVLRKSTRVVAIGETMRRRLIEKGAAPERVRVIPNWVDLEQIRPAARRNDWSSAHGLDGKFVVMHSGNVGYAQDLDSLVHAAALLRDRDDIRVVIVGRGSRHRDILDLAARLGTTNVEFVDHQERAQLSLSLSAADVHFIGLARGLAGFVVPSRLYGVLAVGRPVIAACETASETAQAVEEAGCGVVVPPGRADLLAAAMRDAADGRFDLEEMGRAARAYVERAGGRQRALNEYLALVLEVLPGAGHPR